MGTRIGIGRGTICTASIICTIGTASTIDTMDTIGTSIGVGIGKGKGIGKPPKTPQAPYAPGFALALATNGANGIRISSGIGIRGVCDIH